MKDLTIAVTLSEATDKRSEDLYKPYAKSSKEFQTYLTSLVNK